MAKSKCTRLSMGTYQYKNYRLTNCGYHHPDHCVWWEAIDISTNTAALHAHTKRELIRMVDEEATLEAAERTD